MSKCICYFGPRGTFTIEDESGSSLAYSTDYSVNIDFVTGRNMNGDTVNYETGIQTLTLTLRCMPGLFEKLQAAGTPHVAPVINVVEEDKFEFRKIDAG